MKHLQSHDFMWSNTNMFFTCVRKSRAFFFFLNTVQKHKVYNHCSSALRGCSCSEAQRWLPLSEGALTLRQTRLLSIEANSEYVKTDLVRSLLLILEGKTHLPAGLRSC